jgi:hypothetical protein
LFLRQRVPHDHGFMGTGHSHWFLCFSEVMGVILSFLVVMSCWVELLDMLTLDFVAEYLILGYNLRLDSVDEEQHISLGSSNDLCNPSKRHHPKHHDTNLSMRQIGQRECHQSCLIVGRDCLSSIPYCISKAFPLAFDD